VFDLIMQRYGSKFSSSVRPIFYLHMALSNSPPATSSKVTARKPDHYTGRLNGPIN
jgi:hypothetical protein